MREGEGKGREGEGKREEIWRGPESGLPRGPRWLSAGLHIAMEANRKPYPSFRMVPFSMTLNDP